MTHSAEPPSARPPEEAPPAGALPDALLSWIVALAARAPSVYETEPWYFVGDGRRLELFADPARRLDVPDPEGRLQLLACGAALFRVRLALLRLGRTPLILLFPDEKRADLIATVSFGSAGTTSMRSSEWQLLEAVRHREAQGASRVGPLPWGALESLHTAAELERAHFQPICLSEPFDGGSPIDPDVGVVWTDADTRLTRLEAGAAVARVLLAGTANGLRARLVRDPLDLSLQRVLLRRRTGVPGEVQAVVRLNSGPDVTPRPRRPSDGALRFASQDGAATTART